VIGIPFGGSAIETPRILSLVVCQSPFGSRKPEQPVISHRFVKVHGWSIQFDFLLQTAPVTSTGAKVNQVPGIAPRLVVVGTINGIAGQLVKLLVFTKKLYWFGVEHIGDNVKCVRIK